MSVSTTAGANAPETASDGAGGLVGSAWWDVAAPVSILIAPVVAFAAFHKYSYFTLEFLVGIGFFILVGAALGLVIVSGRPWRKIAVITSLLTVYVDLQFGELLLGIGGFWSHAMLPLTFLVFLGVSLWLHQHLTLMITTIFGTIVLSTLLIPPQAAAPRYPVSPNLSANTGLPTIVHIVLDEHIGVEGLPMDLDVGAEMKQDIKAFFEERGFYVFGSAFSRFYRSEWSLGHILNPGRDFDPDVIEQRNDRIVWQVRENDYLRRIEDAGYNIKVYQFQHLDYCASIEKRLVSCRTDNVSSMGAIQDAPLTVPQKLRVIAGYYVYYSTIYRNLRIAYDSVAHRFVTPTAPLSQWYWERNQIGSIAGLAGIDQLRVDLQDATRGEYYLAHLNTPHYPYLYDRHCRLLEPEQWATRDVPRSLRKYVQMETFRAHNYERYLEQMRCMYAKLGELLDVIENSDALKDAVVILHGDHGSRMALREPTAENWGSLKVPEIVDNFSTLFALRAPAIGAGYDRRQASIQRLLGGLSERRFQSIPDTDAIGAENHVMIRDANGWVERPMPDFGAETD